MRTGLRGKRERTAAVCPVPKPGGANLTTGEDDFVRPLRRPISAWTPSPLLIRRRGLGHEARNPPVPAGATGPGCLRAPGRGVRGLAAPLSEGQLPPPRRLPVDPQFIAAHTARHPRPPLVVAGYDVGYHGNGVVCDIVDLSGKVVRRIRTEGKEWGKSVNLDFICTYSVSSNCMRLFNMTTGDVFALPQGLLEEHGGERDILDYTSVAALGQVASTGEYKVLRVLACPSIDNPHQLCEVFTLDGSSHTRWRGNKGPSRPISVILYKNVVVDGIVYFGQDYWLPSTSREKNGGRVSGDPTIHNFVQMKSQWLP